MSLLIIIKRHAFDAATCISSYHFEWSCALPNWGLSCALAGRIQLYKAVVTPRALKIWCPTRHITGNFKYTFSRQMVLIIGKNTESVHCTITGPCLRMRHRLQHVHFSTWLPIWNIYHNNQLTTTEKWGLVQNRTSRERPNPNPKNHSREVRFWTRPEKCIN